MTKIGFISDIHGNIEALDAVLQKIYDLHCDKIVCLGDIVGYGASPQECIQRVRDRGFNAVMGNHDEYATLIMDPRIERLRPEIKESIIWTQSKLSIEDLKWLSRLPKRLVTDDFSALHSSFATNSTWAYCLDEETMSLNFTKQDVQLAFCGHSHSPMIGINSADGRAFVDQIRNGPLPANEKVMVNVGSVGQPRDRNNLACLVVMDTDNRSLELHRVPYDVNSAMQKILDAGLPRKFADRLEFGR